MADRVGMPATVRPVADRVVAPAVMVVVTVRLVVAQAAALAVMALVGLTQGGQRTVTLADRVVPHS